jgi:uncharacterized damage-inducible protein DinB
MEGLLMTTIKVDLIKYADTVNVLKTAIWGLNSHHLTWKALPNQWSVTEVLSHLLDHNIITTFRIREILSESTSVLPGFNQDQWVSGTKGNEEAAEDILISYQALLDLNLRLFRRLSDEDWNKKGVNAMGDEVHLYDLVTAFINHVHHHVDQIERIKSSY